MAVLSDKERKALGPHSALSQWHGEVHFRVHVWDDSSEYQSTGFFELRADAEEFDRDQVADGMLTSGVQVWKGPIPTSAEEAS